MSFLNEVPEIYDPAKACERNGVFGRIRDAIDTKYPTYEEKVEFFRLVTDQPLRILDEATGLAAQGVFKVLDVVNKPNDAMSGIDPLKRALIAGYLQSPKAQKAIGETISFLMEALNGNQKYER